MLFKNSQTIIYLFFAVVNRRLKHIQPKITLKSKSLKRYSFLFNLAYTANACNHKL